jgi:hypothetical protein
VDAVESQFDAYNARDVEAFVACYAPGVVIEDADGLPQMRGRDEMRQSYGEFFRSAPSLCADLVARIRVGAYVVDEERVSGLPDGGEIHAVAIYRLGADGLIDRVRFLP